MLQGPGITRLDRAPDFAGSLLSSCIRGFTTGGLYNSGFAINRGSYSSFLGAPHRE
jgi:hypothetical protein